MRRVAHEEQRDASATLRHEEVEIRGHHPGRPEDGVARDGGGSERLGARGRQLQEGLVTRTKGRGRSSPRLATARITERGWVMK